MGKKSSTAALAPIDLAPVATAAETGLQELNTISSFICIASNQDFDEAVGVINAIKKRKDELDARISPVKAAAKALDAAVKTMTKGFEAKYTELEEAYKEECRAYLNATDKDQWPETGRLQGGQWVVTVEDQQKFLERVTADPKMWYLLSVNEKALKALASAQTTLFSMPGCTAKQSQSLFLGKEE